MSDATKVPALPTLTTVEDPAVRGFLEAVKQIIETREARRGNELDRFVTLRDLTDSGIADQGALVARKRLPRNPLSHLTDLTPPAAVSGLTTSGAYSSIILTWDIINALSYPNFSHVELWRSDTDALGTAVKIGESAASIYTDALGTNRTAYYWARLVSQADVVGPFNSVSGTPGSTSPDIAYLLTQLTGQITETQLYADLGARIDLVDDAGALTTTVTKRLDDLYSTVQTGFVSQDTFNSYVTADQVFAEQVRSLVFIDPTDGTVSALEGVIIAADTDRNYNAVRFDALDASVGANSARITHEETSRATGDNANATAIATLRTDAANTYATIVNLNTVNSDLTGSIASSTNAITARLDSIGGVSLEQKFITQADTNTGLLGQYTVKIQQTTPGGPEYITGFGLASTLINGSPKSEFLIRADRFVIGTPGASSVIPFIVTGGTTYIKSAMIQDASITSAKIGSVNADTITAGALNATLITVGSLSGDRITANSLNADRLVTNTLAAKFAQITDAYVGSANIANYIKSDDFNGVVNGSGIPNVGTNGWAISKGGDAVFSRGVFRGTLQGATGTFSGALSGASGSFAGSLTGSTIDGVTGTFTGTLGANVINIQTLSGKQYTPLTSSGSVTLDVAGHTMVRITLFGAGGGGSGDNLATANGGGQAGARAMQEFTVPQYATISVSIGAGGSPGAQGTGAIGGTGGSTSASGPGVSVAAAGGAGYGSLAGATGEASAYGAGGAGASFNANASAGGTAAGGGAGGGFHVSGGSDLFTRPAAAGGGGYAIIESFNPNGVVSRTEYNVLLAALQRQGIAVV